jgi:putative nucleotidyltransferase with HDIG domain
MEPLLASNRSLDKIVTLIGDLPATPGIVSLLMSLTTDVNINISRITRAILSDQSLTARVLRLSNSSFYGRSKEVRTLNDAVVILGFKTLRSLVVAMSTQAMYRNGGKAELQNKLWEHALATAICSRQIAQVIGFGQSEEAFIAGLLHDIGKLVMIQKMPQEYGEIIARVESSDQTFVAAEEAEFGFNHTDVGLLLLHKWAFPRDLAIAVFEHHAPIDPTDEHITLSMIVNVGNFLAKQLGRDPGAAVGQELSEYQAIRMLRLDTEKIESILMNAAAEFEQEKKLFQ